MGDVGADFDQIDTQLATEDFNAVEFVNSYLPDENSLQKLPTIMRQLSFRTRKISASIKESIRSYSVLGDSSDAILNETRNSIVDLSQRIAMIHDQATETENVVAKICEGIKPLDNAKRNLSVSVTVLRRLQMISTTIDALSKNIEAKNYKDCSENVLALTTLFDYFKKYSNSPQLSPLLGKFFDLKRGLRNQVNLELDSKLFRGQANETNLPLCAVVDSFNDDFRPSTIDWFCDKFLAPYDDSHQKTPLNNIKARYQWFKQRMDFFNRNYVTAFPKEWRLQYYLSRAFCQKTKIHLTDILKSEDTNVKEYLNAFEYTVKFEGKMADSFATTEVMEIDPNAPMPEFDSTAEGIKAKYKWKEMQKSGVGETIRVPAKEFNGMIASAFQPKMDLYLDHEKKEFTQMISESQNKPYNDIDQEENNLKSAAVLIQAMKKTIDKCAGFGNPEKLMDMFMIIKDMLVLYVSGLTRILPSRPKKPEHFQLMCAIANTSSLMLSIVDSLATKLSSLVDETRKAGIKIDDVKDSIGAELKKQLVYIVDVIVAEAAIPLAQIGNNNWTSGEGDGSKLPPKLRGILEERFGQVGEWITNDNMNRLRIPFVQKVISTVHDALFKSKAVSVDAASRIMITVKELKSLIAYFTNAESKMSQKRIESEFLNLEVELTILCCPEIAMAATYLTKSKNTSKEHFISIVRLRGLSIDMERTLSNDYDQQKEASENT